MSFKSIVLHAFFFSVIFFACKEEPECDQEIPHNKIIVGFYEMNDDEEEFEKVFVKFKEITANGSDSLLYSEEDSLGNFSFVLNASANEVVYKFKSSATKLDSLVLGYSRQLNWLSETCGPNFFYDQLSIKSHTFDSVHLVRPEIDNSIDENIQIYR